MNLKEAKTLWDEKYPESNVTFQTIRNWASKYGFGKKKNFLPRSEWIIDDKKFNDFLQDPEKYLLKKSEKNENN